MSAFDDILKEIQARKAWDKSQADAAKKGKEGADTFDKLSASMSSAKNLGGAFGKVLGTIASVSKIAMAGLGPIGAILGSLTGALTAPIDAIKEMADAIIQLVGLANPGAVQQFTLALNDAMAVLGAALTPALEGMTIAMRAIGDLLAAMMPIFQPLFNQIGQSIANWAVGVRAIWQAASPLIELFVDGLVVALKAVSVGVAFFQGALSGLVENIARVVSAIAGLFGVKLGGKFNPDASSQGAAVRQFKSSSVDQFSKDLFAKQLSVLSKGGQGKTPEAHLEDISKAIAEGQKLAKQTAEYLEKIYNWITNTLPTIINSLIPSVPKLGDIPTSPLDALGQILARLGIK